MFVRNVGFDTFTEGFSEDMMPIIIGVRPFENHHKDNQVFLHFNTRDNNTHTCAITWNSDVKDEICRSLAAHDHADQQVALRLELMVSLCVRYPSLSLELQLWMTSDKHVLCILCTGHTQARPQQSNIADDQRQLMQLF